MEELPFGFLAILLGFFVGALLLTFILYGLRQHRLHRLKDPYQDYLRGRS